MKARHFSAAAAILALVIVVTVVVWPDRQGESNDLIGPRVGAADASVEGEDPAISDVSPGPTRSSDEPDSGALEGSTERVAVHVQPDPAPLIEVVEPEPLQGYVVDAAGRPMADIELIYSSDSVDAARFDREPMRRGRSRTSQLGLYRESAVRTDQHGEFLFRGPDRKAGGSIRFAGSLYLEGCVVAPVDPESDWHALQALPTPHQDSTLTFWLTLSTALKPVEIEDVLLEHLEGTFDFPRRAPLARERTIETSHNTTKIVQRGLPPGKWRFTFIARHGLHQRVVIDVEKPGTEQQMTVLVEAWPDALATDLTIEPQPDGTPPWIDASSGMDEWLPEQRLQIGERQRDRHFAQSIRIGHGPVKAAELTLTITTTSGMCTNDAIYLEHLGSREFAWASSIDSLVGGWRSGMRRTLHLDLARLTDREGNPVDLRPHLEDGLLDVVVQDDTAIESMSLRIVR